MKESEAENVIRTLESTAPEESLGMDGAEGLGDLLSRVAACCGVEAAMTPGQKKFTFKCPAEVPLHWAMMRVARTIPGVKLAKVWDQKVLIRVVIK